MRPEKNKMVLRVLRLLSLLPRKPGEFCERVVKSATTRWESAVLARPSYEICSQDHALRSLGTTLQEDLEAKLHEVQLAEIEMKVRQVQERIPYEALRNTPHNAGPLLARFCYGVARSLRPKIVVETGVCFGVTSACLLQALEVNREGRLCSIDLPPLDENVDDYVGWLVPGELRNRWTLHRGTSSRLLQPLLARLGEIDLFIHDSSHTYRNMRMEFTRVWPSLRRGGVLISDDIEGNRAFLELAAMPDVACSFVLREQNKGSLIGVAVKHARTS